MISLPHEFLSPTREAFSRLRVFAIVIMTLLIGACDESFDSGRKLDPILIREVIPADSVLIDEGAEFTLSIRFNRPIASNEVNVNILPAPSLLSNAQFSRTKHTMYFEEVRLDEEAEIHTLLIDGESVYKPRIFTWWDGITGFAFVRGRIRSQNLERTRDADVLVFLLPLETGFTPDNPSTFERAMPISALIPRWSDTEGVLEYRHRSLPDGKPFFVTAVADTDGNGKYDPALDWWGAYGVTREQPFLFLETVTSATNLESEDARSYDFSLKRPGTQW